MAVSAYQEKEPQAPALFTRQYAKFRGVDFSTDPAKVNPDRSPYAVNVVSDSGGYPEKRPGWSVLHTIAGSPAVNGLHFFVTSAGTLVYVAHIGTKLYTWDETAAVPVQIYATAANAKSVSFAYNGILYILDGTNYLSYNGTAVAAVTGYIPTTVIGAPPAGGGTAFEAVNLIQAGRKNSFIGDAGTAEVAQLQISSQAAANGDVSIILNGATVNIAVLTTDTTAGIAIKIAAGTYTGWTAVALGDTVTFTAAAVGVKSDSLFDPGSTGVLGNMITLEQGAAGATLYQLDATGLDATAVTLTIAGVAKTENTHFTVNRTNGTVDFTGGSSPHGAPASGNGVDNVVITFYKTVSGYADRIKKCTIAAWFGMGNDSRIFVSGNSSYPNMDWQSGLYDPTYFPDTGYTKVGADTSAIVGYLRQFDNMLIIKADNEQDATIFKRTAELNDDNEAIFPLRAGVAGVGAVSKYAFGILRDDPLFLAKEGVFATTVGYGDVTQQRYAQERSYYVKPRLLRETNLQNAVAAVWKGLYVLCVNEHCYVADSKQKTGKSGTETAGYEWYYWTNIPAVCFMVYGDTLYFGTSDGRICKFSTLSTVYQFADNDEAIDAYWGTILDDDGDFMRFKTMPKMGSGVMIKPYSKSSVKVYLRSDTFLDTLVKTGETDVFDFGSVDFSEFSFSTQDAPEIIPLGVKVKKYKTLQIIVRNNELNEGFGVYGIIKRFMYGGFVK
jgi:hypothetical protein